MFDLDIILDQKQININEFFEISQSEKQDAKADFCNVEISFKKVEVPVFSDLECEYQRVDSFENFHNQEEEISAKIIERDAEKGADVVKNYETEHRYIDFSHTIVGTKVKNIDKIKSKTELRFDDIFFSKYMLKCKNLNDDFY